MKFNVYVLLALTMVQCRKADHTPFNAESSYHRLVQSIDHKHPGRALDVFDDEIKDRPMAYSLILSAQANIAAKLNDSLAWVHVRNCGHWLLENSNINQNNITGYGIADPWDAFADGSLNPAHQEYTITTSMAINAMLDWYAIEKDSLLKKRILLTVNECLQPYIITKAFNFPPYSFNDNDKSYVVFNPAILLAGQMQRIAGLVTDSGYANLLKNRSNDIVLFLLKHELSDVNGNAYWNYGTYNNEPNDLLHALYIIEGFRSYIQYGGKHVDKVNWENITGHLNMFYQDGKWRELFAEKYRNDDYNARLWALGLLIRTLTLEGKFDTLEKSVFPQLKKYATDNGHFNFRENEDRVMIRQEAHLMYGLSSYLTNRHRID